MSAREQGSTASRSSTGSSAASTKKDPKPVPVDLTQPIGPEPERVWKPLAGDRQSLLQQRKSFMIEQARRKFLEEESKKTLNQSAGE